jgi:DNA-binding MarR family transcriptional regulator
LSRGLKQKRGADSLVSQNEALSRHLAARVLLFHQAVAQQLGLNATDLKCLELAARQGQITAGKIAAATGLTTPGVTSALDRLEKAGFIQRENDPLDRRKVVIQPVAARAKEVETLFESLKTSNDALCSRYTDKQLIVVNDFFSRSIEVLESETKKLQSKIKTL